MANPTSCGVASFDPVIVLTGTTPVSITLEPNKQYEVHHNGIGEAGTAVTDAIMLATGTATAALTAGSGQAILGSSRMVTVGPGITTLTFDATANAPTVSIFPIINDFGNH